MPATRTAAGMTANAPDTQGKYVDQVNVAAGEIIIRYGNEANAAVVGNFLFLTPFLSIDQSVIWRCGNAPNPVGVAMGADTAAGTTVPNQYLPSACRP